MTEKILSIISREKKLIASCVSISFLLFVLYAAFLYKPVYKTDAKIFIRNIPKYNASDVAADDATSSSQSGYSNPLFNMVQILESESLSSKIYNSINLMDHKELEKIKSARDFHVFFKNKFKTKIVPSTDTISLNLTWPDKESATGMLLETILQFKNENLELRRSIETKQREYFDNYLKEIEGRLSAVRQQIKEYRISKGIINTDEESGQLVISKYDLEKQISVLKSQINYNDRKLANYSKQIGFSNAQSALRATAIGQDPYLETLRKDLATAEQRYANLTGKFNDAYPEVIAVRNEIKSLNSNIEDRNKESLQDVSVKRGLYDKPSQDLVSDMSRVQAETSSLRGQLASLTSELSNLRKEESKLPDKILNYEELKKQEDTLKTVYDNVKKKQLDSKFKENEIVDNIFILDSPSKPKKDNAGLLLSFLGFMYLGALSGILAGWVKEKPEENTRNSGKFNSFDSYSQIGNLPYINSKYFEEEYNDNGLVKSTESLHGTSYMDIASNMVKYSETREVKAISFICSSVPERNSSFITPNIAANLARLGKSVVLISSDSKCSEKHKENLKINSDNRNDLIEVIKFINHDISEFSHVTNAYINTLVKNSALEVKFDSVNNKHFDILPVISEVENLYDYFASKGFDELINFLKASYDFVLIDMPSKPATYPVCSLLMQKADLNVMIADITVSQDIIAEKIREFKDLNLDVSCVISREAQDDVYKTIDKPRSTIN